MSRRWLSIVIPVFALVVAAPAAAAPQDELRAVFDKFVAAQNDHDLRALEPLLLDSPDFLWITHGVPVWGRAEVLEKFGTLFEGTWKMEVDPKRFRVVQSRRDMAQVFAPVLVTIAPPGKAPRQALLFMNQTLVKSDGAWRIASILPVSIPAPRE